MQVKRNRLPDFLKEENLFLGKFLILSIVSYNDIFDKKLLEQESVFETNKQKKML